MDRIHSLVRRPKRALSKLKRKKTVEHSGTERGRKGKREDLVAGMETKSHNPARATEAKCPSDEWADSSLPRVRGGGQESNTEVKTIHSRIPSQRQPSAPGDSAGRVIPQPRGFMGDAQKGTTEDETPVAEAGVLETFAWEQGRVESRLVSAAKTAFPLRGTPLLARDISELREISHRDWQPKNAA
ncbi:hypothetical protein DL95DRAFT_463247 [Leptodontidium sp. 2 PMI_412]|nr:hypothetical protein DL95DRAFT_463247 [Leptodontidium sp. 2 PMI_412]